MSIYPNPTRDWIEIGIPEGFRPEKIKIYSTSGRLYQSEAYSGRISVANLPDGIYFLELKDKDKRVFIAGFVKE